MFGARGAGNFLTRLTTASAVIFMFTSLTLAYFGRTESTLLDDIEETTESGFEAVPGSETVPANPGDTPTTDGGGFEAVEPSADTDSGGFEAVEPSPAADAAEADAPEAPAEAPAEPQPTTNP